MINIIAAFILGIAFTIIMYWIIKVLIDVHKRKKAKDVVKKLRKYVIYCVDPFDDDRLGKLQFLSSAQDVSLEDFPTKVGEVEHISSPVDTDHHGTNAKYGQYHMISQTISPCLGNGTIAEMMSYTIELDIL